MVCIVCSRHVLVDPVRGYTSHVRPAVPPGCPGCGALPQGKDADLLRFIHRLADCGLGIDDRCLLQS